ncbi:unnamed protein product [Arctia plantaginis]|uniref:Uncharacterized protein n=1 Tax=Arctia plantaginis TaxID=874455 RepID=A0A8S0Z378_ARCPL|nr:unnamed protein product [Arctia plantaginis]
MLRVMRQVEKVRDEMRTNGIEPEEHPDSPNDKRKLYQLCFPHRRRVNRPCQNATANLILTFKVYSLILSET